MLSLPIDLEALVMLIDLATLDEPLIIETDYGPFHAEVCLDCEGSGRTLDPAYGESDFTNVTRACRHCYGDGLIPSTPVR